ncbi:FAD-dependent monooxygenase [Streptomyces sp. ST2-7A]|uniref:FAD-dependent monooxygenase n=1 Tax=Streptomyces sp. ST2-7A TaxID=2907214 RepID=UPI001F2C5CDF|nr:FAD-dependent monooxygenase [Streptomyces sp. ST2-7A]MCE7080573.1 FAD-dependent monooxygenase [Streptomyces sp. ST2-7A]
MSSAASSEAPAPGDPGRPRVAVVGAGIGGLTLAAALARVGVPCTVFERAGEFSPVGAGLQLAPNAVRLLHRLGLAPRLRERAVRPVAREIRRWENDALLSRLPLGEECARLYGAPYLTVHRADLHEALSGVAGDRVRRGRSVVGVESLPDGALLWFADGTGHRADAVVGADGIRSVVRGTLVRDAPVFSGHVVHRGLVPVERVPEAADPPRVTLWFGPGRHCVCYPVSGGRWLSFVATVPVGEAEPESWTTEGEPAELAAAYRGWNDTVSALFAAAARTGRWSLYDRKPLAAWSSDRVTLLGDAAHPMLPFLAQGANQAVEDALTLAVCLSRVDRAGVPEALRRYESLRLPRTTELQRDSRGTTAATHLPDGEAQRARDAALRHAGDLRSMARWYGHDAMAVAAGRPPTRRPVTAEGVPAPG